MIVSIFHLSSFPFEIIITEISVKYTKPITLNTLQNYTLNSSLSTPVSYTHLRAHETSLHLVCRLLLEKKK